MDLINEDFLQFFACAKNNKLRYLMIGGYAVNFHGYNRNTQDLDIWLAPTNENKIAFVNTLVCMGYSNEEVNSLKEEDFTQPFIANIGSPNASIDFLTVVHHLISFDKAENEKSIFSLNNDTEVSIVSYDFLIEIKLKAMRPKDFSDIEQLNKLRKK